MTELLPLIMNPCTLRAGGFKGLPYFLGYKTGVFSFQNNPKDLDPSYKTDLDL